MDKIKIVVNQSGKDYAADVEGTEYLGSSPDEAIGYAIREMWLNGCFDKPVNLSLEINT